MPSMVTAMNRDPSFEHLSQIGTFAMTPRSETPEFQSPGLSARAPAAAWPRWLFGLLVVALVAGCTGNRQTAEVRPGPDIGKFTTYYVVESAPDKHGVNDLIKNRLIARGYQAITGPKTAAPGGAAVVVMYRDKWSWDLAMYMSELTVAFYDPRTGSRLALGESRHPAASRRPTAKMVDEVLTNIFEEARDSAS